MLYPITSFCNQRCIFCSAYGRDDESFDLKAFISELSKDEDKLIIISGGEPFTIGIDNLIYILTYLVKRNKRVEIQTNATLLNDIDIKKMKLFISLLNKTDGYFNINLSAHNNELDSKITGLKNGFSKKINSILKIKNLGGKIRLTYVINKLNYKFLTDFSNFVIEKLSFIDWIQFSFVKGIGKAKKDKSIIPRYSMVSGYLIKAMENLKDAGIKFEVDHIPLCFLGKFYMANVDVKKMKKQIDGEYLREKSRIESCKGCKFYKICSGPRKDYIEVYKKL